MRIGAGLSLSGSFARFDRWAALGLETWRSLQGDVELLIEDHASDPVRLAATVRDVASRSDLLLGPYWTRMTRAAARAFAMRAA